MMMMKIIIQARKRSYLVGSVGPTSLLGTQELERQLILIMRRIDCHLCISEDSPVYHHYSDFSDHNNNNHEQAASESHNPYFCRHMEYERPGIIHVFDYFVTYFTNYKF